MSYTLSEEQPQEEKALDFDFDLMTRLVQNAFIQFEALTDIKIIQSSTQVLVTTKELWDKRVPGESGEGWMVTFYVDNTEPPSTN